MKKKSVDFWEFLVCNGAKILLSFLKLDEGVSTTISFVLESSFYVFKYRRFFLLWIKNLPIKYFFGILNIWVLEV